ncbi:hypothetical protein B9Q02_09955 [Candidatus Marsarchaeota G1 archaeon BE_D]|jgi:predicted transcriptional regulator|uniref:ArnR1-like winged helix-turn-helix domain-containing protein n=1 Tax=Candidatus Marsarchaeota G1 archaeon BE_D TaxID=1978156 RepID=A0A2R6ACH9_9ARCH|nr:MAG: hypothetical protein B9Q02_09955 [Candidatus Marsarchaeota G1 archaeon BE_D]
MYKITLKDMVKGRIKKSKRRDGVKIIRDILEIAWEGSRKTRIMFQANLNPRLLKKYLDFCLKHGLLEEVEGKYYTTEKGKKYIKLYSEIAELEERYSILSDSLVSLLSDTKHLTP